MAIFFNLFAISFSQFACYCYRACFDNILNHVVNCLASDEIFIKYNELLKIARKPSWRRYPFDATNWCSSSYWGSVTGNWECIGNDSGRRLWLAFMLSCGFSKHRGFEIYYEILLTICRYHGEKKYWYLTEHREY